jgi:hypothetical protein
LVSHPELGEQGAACELITSTIAKSRSLALDAQARQGYTAAQNGLGFDLAKECVTAQRESKEYTVKHNESLGAVLCLGYTSSQHTTCQINTLFHNTIFLEKT